MIGIFLVCLVISAGAIAKTPERSTFHESGQPDSDKPGKTEMRSANFLIACNAAHGRSSPQHSANHGGRVRHRYASHRPVVDGGGGPPDAFLGPMQATGRSEIGKAAWYNLVGGYTSSGERLDTATATAAHRSLPLTSYAKVTNLDSGRSVIVKINDRGPWSRRFIIDLSPRAADEIDMKRLGVAAVIVEPVAPEPMPVDEAAPTVAAFQGSVTPVAQ
jgi:rare lipoprotein A (peptidoglycan hydrolase)